MSEQLTPQQLEKIVDLLPTAGGAWSVQQKARSSHDERATFTTVSPVLILGPGDRGVGHYVAPGRYQPLEQATYWHIYHMEAAGWVTGQMVPTKGRPDRVIVPEKDEA